jgi:uncharacterized membrane protein YcjF (UPF0283 family)
MLAVTNTSWWEMLFLSHPQHLVALVGLAALTIIAVVALITTQWRRIRQTEAQARLKEQMIQRGYSAQEIIAVINAGEGRDQVSKAATPVNDLTSQPDRGKSFAG